MPDVPRCSLKDIRADTLELEQESEELLKSILAG